MRSRYESCERQPNRSNHFESFNMKMAEKKGTRKLSKLAYKTKHLQPSNIGGREGVGSVALHTFRQFKKRAKSGKCSWEVRMVAVLFCGMRFAVRYLAVPFFLCLVFAFAPCHAYVASAAQLPCVLDFANLNASNANINLALEAMDAHMSNASRLGATTIVFPEGTFYCNLDILFLAQVCCCSLVALLLIRFRRLLISAHLL